MPPQTSEAAGPTAGAFRLHGGNLAKNPPRTVQVYLARQWREISAQLLSPYPRGWYKLTQEWLANAEGRGVSMKVPEEGLRLLFKVSKRSSRKFLRHYMTSWAAALAYHALFAIIPFLALLVVLLWLLGLGNFVIEWLADQTSSALQGQTAEVVEQWIEQSEYQSLDGWLSIGIVSIGIAVWSVSSGLRTLTRALNTVNEAEENRPSWKRYGLSFLYALGLAIMVILAAALLLIGPELVGKVVGLVGLDKVFISLWTWLRLPVALVLLMLVVSIVYWAVPNVNHPYRLITPGAALAVIVW